MFAEHNKFRAKSKETNKWVYGKKYESICCGFYVEIKKCIYPDWCDPDDYSDFIQDYEKQNSIAEIVNESGNVEVIGNIYI